MGDFTVVVHFSFGQIDRPTRLYGRPLAGRMQTTNEDATLVSAVATPSSPSTMRKLLSVLATALLVVGATVGVLVANHTGMQSSVGSGVDISVCYDSYQDSQINQHFKTIRQRFSGVRTFQTNGSRNAIDSAADAGLKIYAGVWIRTDENSINADMQAVVDGVKRNPKIVKGVYVGNEELANGIDQQTVINRVKQMKQKLSDAGYGWIPVGSVQVDGDWFGAPDLAAACDIIGANIHPWKALYNKFGSKVVLTETGWPTSGGDYGGHKPGMSMTKSFYSQFQNWARNNGGDMPSFFIFNDNPNKSPDYQASFGLAWSNGSWKFDADPDIKDVVIVNPHYDRVLAVVSNRQVEFHYRWAEYWMGLRRQDQLLLGCVRAKGRCRDYCVPMRRQQRQPAVVVRQLEQAIAPCQARWLLPRLGLSHDCEATLVDLPRCQQPVYPLQKLETWMP
ncbi:hypothetical protein LEN26_002308 [Aphanomyces euteiches]|nr:hypothetical protein LEN26_002308 [Aphanomyces euteiches]